jgi:hypothetical protein
MRRTGTTLFMAFLEAHLGRSALHKGPHRVLFTAAGLLAASGTDHTRALRSNRPGRCTLATSGGELVGEGLAAIEDPCNQPQQSLTFGCIVNPDLRILLVTIAP